MVEGRNFVKSLVPPPAEERIVKRWEESIRLQQIALDEEIRKLKVQEEKNLILCRRHVGKKEFPLARNFAHLVIQARKEARIIYPIKALLIALSGHVIEQYKYARVDKKFYNEPQIREILSDLLRVPCISRDVALMSHDMGKHKVIDSFTEQFLESIVINPKHADVSEAEMELLVNNVLDLKNLKVDKKKPLEVESDPTDGLIPARFLNKQIKLDMMNAEDEPEHHETIKTLVERPEQSNEGARDLEMA